MGNRVVIQFADDCHEGPGVYMHWLGDRAIELLRKAAPNMRRGDAAYAAARFCAVACEALPGGLSVGILSADQCEGWGLGACNGRYVVNVNSGKVTWYREGRLPRIAATLKMGNF